MKKIHQNVHSVFLFLSLILQLCMDLKLVQRIQEDTEEIITNKSFFPKMFGADRFLVPAEEERLTRRYGLDDYHVDCSKSLTMFTE